MQHSKLLLNVYILHIMTCKSYRLYEAVVPHQMSGLCSNWRQFLSHFSSLHGSCHVDNVNGRKYGYIVVRLLLMAIY